MTRKPVRILWALIGVCLALGALASLLMWLGPAAADWSHKLQPLASFIDLIALGLWMLVFAVYWYRHPD